MRLYKLFVLFFLVIPSEKVYRKMLFTANVQMLLYIEWIHSDDHLYTDNTLFMRHRQTVQARINVNFDILHALIKYIYIEMANQNLKQIETFYIIVDTLFFAYFLVPNPHVLTHMLNTNDGCSHKG